VITKDLLGRRVLSQVQKLRSLGLSVDDVLADYRVLEKRLDKFIKYCVRKHWLRDGRDGKLLLNGSTTQINPQYCSWQTFHSLPPLIPAFNSIIIVHMLALKGHLLIGTKRNYPSL